MSQATLSPPPTLAGHLLTFQHKGLLRSERDVVEEEHAGTTA